MFQDKYVFAQLTAFLNRTQFNNYVRKYDGNRYVKHFTCRNQLLAMMFGQLINRESLRDLIHVLYDVEAQVPAFYTVTTTSKHDSTAMSSIMYEPNSYNIFDRAYDTFKELNKIHLTGSYYVVRAKSNLKYKTVKWKRRMQYAYCD